MQWSYTPLRVDTNTRAGNVRISTTLDSVIMTRKLTDFLRHTAIHINHLHKKANNGKSLTLFSIHCYWFHGTDIHSTAYSAMSGKIPERRFVRGDQHRLRHLRRLHTLLSNNGLQPFSNLNYYPSVHILHQVRLMHSHNNNRHKSITAQT